MTSFRFLVVCALLLSAWAAGQTVPDYDALVQKGKTQLQGGSADLALTSGEAAIKINAERWEGYALVGGALMNLKRYEEAADKFSKAIDRAPDAKQTALRDLRRQCLMSESGGSPAPKEIAPALTTTSQAEIVLWKSIENSNNPNDFQGYLDQYPHGTFVVLAQRHLADANANRMQTKQELERQMNAYQTTGNQAKVLETAQNLLQQDSCNLRALETLTATKRALAESGQDGKQNATEAGQYGERGLQCLKGAKKPEGTPDADFQKLTLQAGATFNGAAGFAAFSVTKDFGRAQEYLRASVDADPSNFPTVYELAVAYLAPGPTEKDEEGVFFVARAANLAPTALKSGLIKYGKTRYVKYHGSEHGWTDLQAAALTSNTPIPIGPKK